MPEEQTGDFDELHLDFDAIANRTEINSIQLIVWHMAELIEIVGCEDGKWKNCITQTQTHDEHGLLMMLSQ